MLEFAAGDTGGGGVHSHSHSHSHSRDTDAGDLERERVEKAFTNFPYTGNANAEPSPLADPSPLA